MISKQLFRQFSQITAFNEPLKRHTTFSIGGPARVFIKPRSLAETQSVYKFCKSEGIPVYILGAGSNILINDKGINGVVIKQAGLIISRKNTIIKVSAAYPLMRLVKRAIDAGLSGLEPLAGIPGSVGGAVMMNAGGKYGEIGQVIKSVSVVNRKGETETWQKDKLKFGYRISNLNKAIIGEVVLQLKRRKTQLVKNLVSAILAEKCQTQPLRDRSAGCVFKNPASGPSAGALIDRAGLKGLAIGGAMVSHNHANFIVNTGNAKAGDVIALIDRIKEFVFKVSGIRLELEIEIW
ncbi:MAG: UDP-N-acetylmuramate dehydrogenase [Planctomycetes bacterium]|nr:UDP-N-acetylmuramate dehydrogenase [Planctomycetota bacterium]